MLQLMCRTRARLLQMHKGSMQEANPAILSIPSFSSKLDPSFDMDVHKYYAEQSSYPSIAMTDPHASSVAPLSSQ